MSLDASQLPQYIYGLHDLGGQDEMLKAQRPGWVVDTIDLSSQVSADYTPLAHAGLGVIVRLNNSYGPAGTIPPSSQYDGFAAKCAALVKNSAGARIWVVGNEMNLASERPTLPDGTREVVTPTKYAQCFVKCRRAIKDLAGHADDWVIPGAVGPYNNETTYLGNPTGDWVQYLVDILGSLGPQVDGIALHCYTHEWSMNQITSEQLMGPPFNHRHFHFRAYRDYLDAMPPRFRNLPVFITETNPYTGWRDSNAAWIQNAYKEIDAWNADPAHQPIQALVLFRWSAHPDHPEWGVGDKPALLGDFRTALSAGYRARWPSATPTPAPAPVPDYRAQWVDTVAIPKNTMAASSVLTGRVVVKNVGSQIWRAGGPNPVRLGYHWYNTERQETPVSPYAGNFPMPDDVPPGGTTIFNNVELRAPQWAGTFTLKWDLVQEGVTWFSARQSPTQNARVKVLAPAAPKAPLPPAPSPDPWAVLFLGHDTPVSLVAGQTVTVNLRMRNVGARAWAQNGETPVHAGYKWFNQSGQPQLDVEDRRTALPSDILPNQEVMFGATLAAPKTPGRYNLRWDMVAEGVTWFADVGNPPLVVPVSVTTLPHDIDAWRVESNLNPHEVAHALDGDTQTHWDSGSPQAPGQWFRLNLSAPRWVDGIQFLSPGKGAPWGYTLRISADGSAWSEVARVASGNSYDVMAVFAAQQMQYAQIDLLAASPLQSTWMISEILVHPATPWKASASDNADAAGLAIDNRPDTSWSSGTPQRPGMWFQIDLGRIEALSGLTLAPPTDENPTGFRVSLWEASASRWAVVADKSGNRGIVDVVFATAKTQFVNIQLTEPSPQVWAIQEARVVREMDAWLGPSKF